MKSLLFKIGHGDWSAEIQIPAAYVLEDLAQAIIAAAAFDFDLLDE